LKFTKLWNCSMVRTK